MISLVVPSRNRPDNLHRLYQSWVDTHSVGELVVVLDDDDTNDYDLPKANIIRRERGNAVQKINWGAEVAKGDIIGFCGDDCIIKTDYWENAIEFNIMGDIGLAYVSDGHDQHDVPNHIFMSRLLYDRLGWFAYPEIVHCYTDHVWRKIGRYVASINGIYVKVPVVFYHDHPDYTDAEWDDIYRQAYNGAQAAKDKIAFENYKPNF